MEIIKLLQDLAASVAALQAQLADAQAAADSIAKEAYDKGFADGVASVPTSDKLYSQEELDAAIAAAVGPLNEKVAELQAQVDSFPAQIDQKVQEAVAALKADLLAKYEAAQADEGDLENSVRELLK